ARQSTRFVAVNELTAAFRRHGSNLSLTGPTSDLENDEIRCAFGPRSGATRAAGRFSTRVYINARNARWSLTKRVPVRGGGR
ncbi:MAG TPA: hypothetical protein VGD55_02635, partial [Acidothermaceae bacterium]